MSKEMLNRHPAVLGAGGIARPDAMSGDVLAPHIETTEDAKAAAGGYAACRRAPLACRRRPRSSAGMIQKFALRHPAKPSSAIE